MLQIEHNFRTFKAETIPGTLLVSVKDSACSKFGLDHLEYGLSYRGKPLDLTSPLRFTGLVNGAKLTLEKVKVAQSARIKLRHMGGDFVGSFELTSTLQQVLEMANATGVVYLGDQEVPSTKTLLEIGVNGSAVFSVRPHTQKTAPSAQAPAPTQTQFQTRPQSPTQAQTLASVPQPHTASSMTADRSAAVSLSGTASASSGPGEPTVAQAKLYMEHLRSQAAPKPLIFKTTQASIKLEKRLERDIHIRIRLPDMSSVEGIFKPQETGEHVFDFLRMYLVDPSLDFSLHTVPPGFELQPKMGLVNDTNFDSRVLLQMVTTAKGPYLNDRAVSLSKVKQANESSGNAAVPPPPTTNSGAGTASGSSKFPKKVPKWFKLGNK